MTAQITRGEKVMRAFHNDKAIKAKYVNRIKHHIKMDNLIRGKSWTGEKGCAVGCTLEQYNHKAYEAELGIPEWLARLEDIIFEGMSQKKSETFPKLFLEAINVGAELDNIKGPFLIYVLQKALLTFDNEKYPEVTQSINSVIDLWTIGEATPEDFQEARRAAAAAYAAAYAAAAAAAAADAAYAAAAAYATTAAAYAATAAAYASASARHSAYDDYADKLLELLKECK